MKLLRLTVGVLFLFLALFSSEINGDDNVTVATTINLDEVSSENAKPTVAFSEDEMVLQKWRSAERMLQDFASDTVKKILPGIIRSSDKINISSKCSGSIMKMIFGLRQMKSWSFKMIDASGKLPNGIMNGYFSTLGDFDGCLSIEVPGSNPFRGQYCTLFMSLPLPKWKPFMKTDDTLPLFANFSKKGTIMREMSQHAHHSYNGDLRTSICMPSTCSREEIQAIIDTIADPTEFPWKLTVPTCDVIEPLNFSTSDIVIIFILSIIGLLAFVATTVDIVLNIISKEKRLKTEASSTAIKCLMCFSTYTNTLRLLKKDSSPDSIKIFHGLKFITLLWVILNHTYYYTNRNISGAVKNATVFGKEIAFQVLVNGFSNVETFFFISAVLVAYGRMKFAGERINILLYIFRRVWRLTPPLMLIIATSMLIPHMGSGPAWKETIIPLIDKCKANWWTNLIFINNFISSKVMCFQWLWYIPVDTHLYLMAILVIVPMKSRPRLAFGINAMLFITGTIVSGACHVYYRHAPTSIYVYFHPNDTFYFTDNSFFRTYTHITTSCIGLCVGYFLATRPELKIPPVLNIFGWLLSVTMGLVVVYGAYDWNQGNVPGTGVSTLYFCTNKIVWALALSYVTIACYTGNGGVISSILGWSAIVPLSRLTYVTYIIHPLIQYMYVGSSRVILQVDHRTNVYRYLANIVAAYCFAYVISLLFESPFMCLEKVMFPKRSQPKEIGKCAESTISTISINEIETNGPRKKQDINELTHA